MSSLVYSYVEYKDIMFDFSLLEQFNREMDLHASATMANICV